MQDLLTFLQKLVAFNTVNDPQANLNPTSECASFIASFLSNKCGIKSEVLDIEGFYSIIGQIGFGEPHILLMAHLDTVPVNNDQWNTNPFEVAVQDDKAYGRGALDNKAGVTILMKVAKHISKLSGNKGTISFVITGDEEVGGRHGIGFLHKRFVNQNQLPDFIINFDANSERITCRRRNGFGVTLRLPRIKSDFQGKKVQIRFETKIEGREMRHSAYFLPGIDQHALLKASKFLLDHRDWKVLSIQNHGFIKSNVVPDYITLDLIVPDEKRESWSVEESLTSLFHSLLALSRINFQTQSSDFGINSLPNLLYLSNEEIEVYFDVRAMTMEKATVQAAFERLAAEKIGKFTLDVRGGQGFLNTPKDSVLAQLALKVAKDHLIDPNLGELEGASDSRYFSRNNIPIIEIGPRGGNLHGNNEYVELSSLQRVASFACTLVEKLILEAEKSS
ncbi:MAG: M20/M25/M40 family metallo-hydrolase [Candidatus Hodarchaeota archaeon]